MAFQGSHTPLLFQCSCQNSLPYVALNIQLLSPLLAREQAYSSLLHSMCEAVCAPTSVIPRMVPTPSSLWWLSTTFPALSIQVHPYKSQTILNLDFEGLGGARPADAGLGKVSYSSVANCFLSVNVQSKKSHISNYKYAANRTRKGGWAEPRLFSSPQGTSRALETPHPPCGSNV